MDIRIIFKDEYCEMHLGELDTKVPKWLAEAVLKLQSRVNAMSKDKG